MKYHSYSPTLAKLHGKKPTWIDRMIGMRSDLAHTEIQFSDRYGGISFSATMADDCKCARFKMISYSHPERWLTTELSVSDEQEDAVFKKCCEMAGMHCPTMKVEAEVGAALGELFFGPNALKYDLAQVSFGFISKLRIKKGDKRKVFCTESCFIALMEAWPELLQFGISDSVTVSAEFNTEFGVMGTVFSNYLKKLDPDDLTPSLGDMIIRDFARRQG